MGLDKHLEQTQVWGFTMIYPSTVFLFAALACPLWPAIALALDERSRDLARCEATFAYGINLFMLLDNEPAAKALVLQMSRSTATNFMRNATDDKVPASIVMEIRREQKDVKPYLDVNPQRIFVEIDRCQQRVTELYNQQSALPKRLFGMSLGELAVKIAHDARRSIGID
jgi:hypothetical protein